ncbi:MAG: NADH:flavin oxidoreductase [Alphaproteobacteria bacterium]|nr:NADH:flavin oxidoreductase [Alphaproteobacteria bacterium]
MTKDSRYDILFEPVRIGPVTTRNRFYQVPHCNGMGHRDPSGMAAMRGVKAEGGWGVVCTEETEIHHSADLTPYIELRIWDDRDIPMLSRMVDAVHAHGALAGIELVHNGMHVPNSFTREVPLGPAHRPIETSNHEPVQARAMDRQDIANFRRWHRNAALRARKAGFDIVYAYAGHNMTTTQHFLSRRHNDRTDEYGGNLENRARLFREIIEDTKDTIGDTCAVAVRMSVDEMLGSEGITKEESLEVIAMLAELPDLWDIVMSGWSNDSQTSRFSPEGFQEPFVAGIKSLTTKPVVGVGRFTSPDAMVSQIRRGILDLIGAARPSIADPFLPRKIEEGRIDEIRECIGCNICVSGDNTMSPIRCTQNPTMGEEWRRGWHPERIRAKESDTKVLVIGTGPSGLECARALGLRGYEVALAEASTEPGGRVAKECGLPGLAAWGRVRDYRVQALHRLPNVEVFYDSALDAGHVLEFGFDHVVVATGATWRADGIARFHMQPIEIADDAIVLAPDDLFSGQRPEGHVVVYDDDHYYMGGVLAELLVSEGNTVTLITPAADVSNWTHNTLEQARIQTRLLELGVEIVALRAVTAVRRDRVESACVYTGRKRESTSDCCVLVTARLPENQLYLDLQSRREEWADAGIRSVQTIGDAAAPATIAHAVYAGHRYAQELDGPELGDAPPFKRELPRPVELA